jgi:hypothetical protein
MQTNPLSLVSGIPKFLSYRDAASRCIPRKETTMSKTASIGLMQSSGLFGRLMASIDRLLTTTARLAARNGDLPYFGL